MLRNVNKHHSRCKKQLNLYFSKFWPKSSIIPEFGQNHSVNAKVTEVNKQQHECKPVCLHFFQKNLRFFIAFTQKLSILRISSKSLFLRQILIFLEINIYKKSYIFRDIRSSPAFSRLSFQI